MTYPMPKRHQLQESWLEILPNEDHREKLASLYADTIKLAASIHPNCWMINFSPEQGYINVNVGRIFALSFESGRISLLLDSEVLDVDSIPDSWGGYPTGKNFKVIPTVTYRIAPIDEIFSRWDQLKDSYFSAVKKAAATGTRSPWWKFHVPEAVDFIAEEAGEALPHPTFPEKPADDNSVDEADLLPLVEEFLAAFPSSPDGIHHRDKVLKSRQVFRQSYADIKARKAAGEDVTNDVLLKLIPHADTPHNRGTGSWTTIAPVINKDMKALFEGGKWAEAKDWPEITNLILEFFGACEKDPANLEKACQDFDAKVPAKGFQAAILSAGLAAINPDEFVIINKKPIQTLGLFTKKKANSKLVNYPETNRRIQEMAEPVAPVIMQADSLEGLHLSERFDMFTHWLIAVRRPKPGKVYYWKIAPGENAFNWGYCRDNGVITMGWNAFGDLTAVDDDSFAALAETLSKEHKGYTPTGTKQLLTFANEIQPGDRIIANKGTAQILGVGTVSGDYFYQEGVDHGHQLPVEWDDITPIPVDEPGWKRTIVSLTEKKFKALVKEAKVVSGDPNVWVFQANPKLFDLENELKDLDQDALTSWRATRYEAEIKVGDIALLWQAGKKAGIYALAKITGPCFKASEEEFLAAEYMKRGDMLAPIQIYEVLDDPLLKTTLKDHDLLQDLHVIRSPQGTNFRVSSEEWTALQALLGPQKVQNRIHTLKDIAQITGFENEDLECWVRAINRKGQGVLYGPPGTGKTFIAEHLAKHMIGGGDGFADLVQFHPAYTYEDFIQGLRPEAKANGTLDYRLVPGRFMEFCRKAAKRKGTCVLILDEINRANLARVFGELMYLMEYRENSVPLAGGETLQVPANVRIIGTMNTADRSIALVDHALRRRFAFINLRPQYQVLEQFHAKNGFNARKLADVLKRLNRAIDDPNYEVGISFFMKKDLAHHLPDIWRMEIEPYLEEYFFDQTTKVKEFRWDTLKAELT